MWSDQPVPSWRTRDDGLLEGSGSVPPAGRATG